MIIKEDSKSELLSALRRNIPAVAPRGQKRRKQDAEQWTMLHALILLAEDDPLEYPLSLFHRDKPDFLLSLNTIELGIETTEAIPESYASAEALWNKEYPNKHILSSDIRDLPPNASAGEIRRWVSKHDCGIGWENHQVEEDWVRYIKKALDRKTNKAKDSSFDLFAQNWLVIYDNLPLPDVEMKVAIDLFSRQGVELTPFSRIMILSGPGDRMVLYSKSSHKTIGNSRSGKVISAHKVM